MNNYGSLVDVLIQSEMDGVPKREQVLLMCHTPRYLIAKCGFSDIPMAIKSSTVSKAVFDHGLAKSFIKKLPKILEESPRFVFKSDTRDQNSVVVFTPNFHRGFPIIVPVRKDVAIGRNRTYNVVTSAYGKEGPDPIQKWRRKGLLIWDPEEEPWDLQVTD